MNLKSLIVAGLCLVFLLGAFQIATQADLATGGEPGAFGYCGPKPIRAGVKGIWGKERRQARRARRAGYGSYGQTSYGSYGSTSYGSHGSTSYNAE